MKNSVLITLALAILLMSQFNCTTPPDAPQNSGDKPDVKCSDDPKFAVPRDSAQADIARYLSEMQRYNDIVAGSGEPLLQDFPLRYFTVRSIDLLEVLGLPLVDSTKIKYQYIRTYIGLDNTAGFKLYLTPVDDANLNAHPPRAGREHHLCGWLPDRETDILSQQEYMLDFAMPCPATCGDN